MALDNLLTYQDQYKQSDEWDVPPPRALLGPGLLAVTAVLGFTFCGATWRTASNADCAGGRSGASAGC